MSEHSLIHGVGHFYQEVELFGDGPKARELTGIVKQHALAGTGIALIPMPGLALAALVANTWTMYVQLNSALGISFGENALRSIASDVFANLASTIPDRCACGKCTHRLPAANIAMMYVAGKLYLKSLEVLIHSGKPLTEENIKTAAESVAEDKTFVRSAYAAANH